MTILLREAIGDRLRHARTSQHRTLREISRTARVSLGYLSEVERGQKEASSELLAAICDALELPLAELMHHVADDMSMLRDVARTASPAPITERAESVPGTGFAGAGAPAGAGSGMVGGGRMVRGALDGLPGTEFADFTGSEIVGPRLRTVPGATASLSRSLSSATGVVVAA